MSKLWKQVSFSTVWVALVLGVIVGASAQVFPVRWTDEPEPEALAVGSGAVAIGAGGISMFPDVVSARAVSPTVFTTPGVQIVPDAGCSEDNRGEIRLGVVQGVDDATAPNTGVVDVDALCFCAKKTVSAVAFYRWNCFNQSNN